MADWNSVGVFLSKVSTSDLSNVCHVIAESFCQDRAITLDKVISTWSLEEWWEVRGALVALMKKSVQRDLSKDQISEELGTVDDSYKSVITEAICVHRPSLKQKLLKTTTAISHAVLSDFDWKLQLALSSDKMSSLHQPFLMLDLDVRQANGERKQVTLELDKEELTKLITSLESCSKSVQQLTVSS